MEKKKPTKGQLEKKLKEATVFVDKAEKSIYLSDIGVGIYITKWQTVLSSNFHRHIWENINSEGYNNVYMYLNAVVDICISHLKEITSKSKEGNIYYTLDKLMNIKDIKPIEKEILVTFNMFLVHINDGIYSIGNNTTPSGIVLLANYYYTLCKSNLIQNVGPKDITVNDFIKDLSMDLFRTVLNVEFNNIDKETIDKINSGIKDIWDDGYSKVKKLIEDNGGEMLDTIAFPKIDNDEAKALNELTN